MTPNCNKLKYYHGPGIWEDLDGGIHFAIPELLAMVGMPDTPENHILVRKMLTDLVKDDPEVKMIHRYNKDGKPNAETCENPGG